MLIRVETGNKMLPFCCERSTLVNVMMQPTRLFRTAEVKLSCICVLLNLLSALFFCPQKSRHSLKCWLCKYVYIIHSGFLKQEGNLLRLFIHYFKLPQTTVKKKTCRCIFILAVKSTFWQRGLTQINVSISPKQMCMNRECECVILTLNCSD